MDAYRTWLVRNRQWLASIESVANTMTWFLPERFSSSELAPEAVSTLLGLLTITNEQIVKTSSRLPHQRFRSQNPDSRDIFSLPFCISIMKEVEVFVEMASEHYGGKETKWNAVATVEAVKVLLRLIMLHKSGYKMLLDGGETENHGKGSQCSEAGVQQRTRMNPMREYMGPGRNGILPANPHRVDMQSTPRDFFPCDTEGRAMQAMSNFGRNVNGSSKPSWTQAKPSPVASKKISAVVNADKSSIGQSTRGFLSKAFVMGEVLLIARPLLYVLLIRRYGLKSWKPWISSLAIDVTGMSLLYTLNHLRQQKVSHSFEQKGNAHHPFTEAEQKELRRRQLILAVYAMRDPFFGTYTRKPLENVESTLKSVPLIGTLAGKAMELTLGVQAFYMYTAAS